MGALVDEYKLNRWPRETGANGMALYVLRGWSREFVKAGQSFASA